MLPKSKTVDFTVTTANVHQLVEDLKIDIRSGYAIQITATAWRANSVTPSAVRIYANGLDDISDNTVVAYNDSPVSGQLGLSTTGVIKNVGNTTIQAYTTIKCSSTGTYKVTVFYSLIEGKTNN